MKKTYINPAMVIVKLKARQQMLSQSTFVGFGEGTKGGNDAAARGFDDWDDEY